jgi:hypothetical protein
VLVLIIILKIKLKKAENGYKKALLAGLGFVGLILSSYLLIFGSSQRKRYRIIPITNNSKKIAYNKMVWDYEYTKINIISKFIY